MAEIKLDANSGAWGSTLSLSSVFSLEDSGFTDTVEVSIKTVMRLKAGAGTLTITPPVYNRIYQIVNNKRVLHSQIKNTNKISHRATNSTYTLIDTTVTLPRGYKYCFELDYSNAYLNGVNIGVGVHSKEYFINAATDPNLTVALASITEKGVNATERDVTVTVNYSSKVTAPFAVSIEAVPTQGSRILGTYNESDRECVLRLQKNQIHRIVCTVSQNGITKTAERTINACEPPYINSFQVVGNDKESLTTCVNAQSIHGYALEYIYTLVDQEVGRTADTEYTFDGLEPNRSYQLEVKAVDSMLSESLPVVCSGRTAPLDKVQAYAVHDGQLVKGTVYYCTANNTPPHVVKEAAAIDGGSIKKINGSPSKA